MARNEIKGDIQDGDHFVIFLFLILNESFVYWYEMARNDFRYSKMAAGGQKNKSCVLIWNGKKWDWKWFPAGHYVSGLSVRLSVLLSVRPSHFRGITLRTAPSKNYAFSTNYHACIAMPTWPRCAPSILCWPWPPYNLLPRSCLTWIFWSILADGYLFACSAQ